jgi:hypothetical protein
MAVLGGTGMAWGTTADVAAAAGAIEYVTSPVKNGAYALRTNPTTVDTGYIEVRRYGTNGTAADLGLAVARGKFDWRYALKPASNDEPILATNGTKPSVRVNSSGNLVLYDSTGTAVATGSTVLAQDTWYSIGFQWGQNTATATITIDGVTEITNASVNCGSGNTARLRYGKASNANSNSVDFFYDNVIIDDAVLPDKDAAVLSTIPASDISTTGFTPSTGVTLYGCIDDIPLSDTDYVVSSGTANDTFLCGVASCDSRSIPTGATFLAVLFQGRHRDSVSSAASNTVLNVKSSSTTVSTTGRDATASSSTAGLMLTTDPATSAAWTRSGIDGVQLGMTETVAIAERVTGMIAQVFYVPPSFTLPPFISIVS